MKALEHAANENYAELFVRWERQEGKGGRYYGCKVRRDLFGHWSLTRIWGGIGKASGSYNHECLANRTHATTALLAVARERKAHGYKIVLVRTWDN